MPTSVVRSVGVLLAAGLGSRFDPAQPGRKLEVLIDGMSVAERSLVALAAAVDAVVVATRSDQNPVSDMARRRGAHVVVPAGASMGMGHSLSSAAETAARLFPDARCLLVALADMPWLKSETIRLLLDTALNEDCIVQPCFCGQRGHPVAFPIRYAEELAKCEGDTGARDVLRRHAPKVRLLDVDDAAVLRDVDVAGDLAV